MNLPQQFTSKNHYVPQFYLRLWSENSKNIWAYKTLVANKHAPLWESKSISEIAFRRHLYTNLAEKLESDDFEHWLNIEFETPAVPVIKKVISDSRLTPDDWQILVKFLASQDVRTPTSYLERFNASQKYLPELLQKITDEAVKKLETAKKTGTPFPAISNTGLSPLPLRVTKHQHPGNHTGFLKAELVIGRALWLFSMRHLLNNTIKALFQHKWTILHAPDSVEWVTSDAPVVKVKEDKFRNWDFSGAWATPNTAIMLPLGPKHLLFTECGRRPPVRGTVLPLNRALKYQEFFVKHGHRMIFAKQPLDISHLHVRTIDENVVKRENEMWQNWHKSQTNAELDVLNSKDSPSI